MADLSAYIRGKSLANEGVEFLKDEVNCAAATATGIDVLIIGAGIGGLTAALECYRKGHTIRIFEQWPKGGFAGDMINIGASGLRFVDHYTWMQREYDDITAHNLWMQYRKWTGEDIGEPFLLAAEASDSNLERHSSRPPVQTQQRPRFDAMLRNQLERFGIKVQWLSRVVEYYEDVERGVGGVVTQEGWRYEADLVIAADGLESKSQELISGSAKKAKPTGRTNFRAAFPLDVVAANPLLNETFGLKDGRCPVQQVWTGPDDTQCIVQSYVDKHGENGRLCFSVAIREPEGGHRKESWDDDDAIYGEEMLRVVDSLPGWSEAMRTLVWLTPPGYILAWPLKHRDLRWTWHSPGARVLQLGDATHPFLPTSDNGATQAIEDSVTIAECLAQAGKDQVTTAVKVHNLLRADRVSCCQLLDFVNNETDLDIVSEDLSKNPYKTPKWIWSLDPEKYATENYARAAASLVSGGPGFVNSNIPAGYVVKPWSIDEIEELQSNGGRLELAGDWS